MVIGDTQIIVLNPVLREILKRYDDAGAFEYLSPLCLDSEYRGVPAAYYDSGYELEHAEELMPRTIDEVTDCIIGIIAYEEEDNPNWDETREQIEAELMERDDEINAAYEYVLIKGSGLGWDEDDEEEYWEYGDVEIPDTSFEYTKEGFWESIESNKAKTKQSPKPKGKKSGKQPLIPKESSKTNDSIPKISDAAAYKGEGADMATYKYNDKVNFILPTGFTLDRTIDDDGDEKVTILGKEYKDDEGEKQYKITCRVNYAEHDPEDEDDLADSADFLTCLAERADPDKQIVLSGQPETIILGKMFPLKLLGHVINMHSLICLVRTAEWSTLRLTAVNRVMEEDSEQIAEIFENLFEVLKTVCVNGKKLPLDGITSRILQKKLMPEFDNSEEAIDICPTFNMSVSLGDKIATVNISGDGVRIVDNSQMSYAFPDEKLYPHYESIKSRGGLGALGINVVVNASGTEYSFIPISRMEEECGVKDKCELFSRIVAKDTEKYTLHEKAKEMQALFHVSKSAFDPKHDRECELEEGLMHRAYMMSGLRSFAWTLADYCDKNDCTPDDIDEDIASCIADFAAEREWLNYNDSSYCKGLCSGSDLHVYYVPDRVSQADRKKLLPSQEELDRVQGIKSKLPMFHVIHEEVHSLNALRKDLEYIYPAIKTMWNYLAADRNYDEALLGNEADIVYAWCALAKAARAPFFTEDGPMTCYFSQLNSSVPTGSGIKTAGKSERRRSTNKSLVATDKSPAITGTRVSYDDCEIDSSGTLSAYNGDEVKIILPDGIRTIGEDAFFGKDELISIVIPEGVERIENGAFWRCDSLENIVLPSTIRSIGDNAFYYCEALTSVVIPDGCEVLGEDCFTFCSNLKDIYVPASVYDIGHDAFCTFNDDTVIHTTRGSIAANYAKENDIKVDHMRVSASLGSSYINESAYVSDDAGQNTAETPISRNKCLIDTDDTLLKYFGDEPRIILPYGIRVIGDYAFDTRENLSSIVIPEGVECIGDSAFFNCVNLEKIVLPSTIRKIGESAFFNCESLTSIVIPEGCTEIGEDCFSCCNNITDIYAPASLYDIGKDAFQTYNSNTVIHAPRGSNVEVYAEENSITLAHNMASASSGSSDEKKSKSASTGSGIKKKSASSNAKKSSTKKAATKPTPDLTADSTAAHKAEEERKQAEAAEAARKAEEARKQAEAAEAARKADEARKQAEAAEAARKAEEERKQAEAAEAARKAEEARRQAEAAEAARKAEEARKQAEAAEAARKAEEARKQAEAAEAARKAEEERKQAEAAEAARRAEEARRRAEVSRLNTVKAKTETAEEIDPIAEERRRLLKERKRQMRIVENNKGLFALFGEKARKRKAAEAKIEQINKELARLRRRK